MFFVVLSSNNPCLTQIMLQRVEKFVPIPSLQIMHALRLYSWCFFLTNGFLLLGSENAYKKCKHYWHKYGMSPKTAVETQR